LKEGAMKRLLPVFRRFIDYVSFGPRRRRRVRGRAHDSSIDVLRGEVVKTVDGDTLQIRDARGFIYDIRLLSIDTPELHYHGVSQGRWAEAAAARLAELLPVGCDVEVRTDEQKFDMYGRVLGYVYSGDLLVNRCLLEEGLAVTYIVAPNLLYAADFSSVVQRSIAERRGMFGDGTVLLPYEFRWSRRRATHARLVGSLSRCEVISLSDRARVPVWDRVFFFDVRDVKPPFALADGAARQDGD
jgi:micrococcal nuclease